MTPSYLQLLEQFIAFKSISTDPAYKNDCKVTADRLVDLLKNWWLDAKVIPNYGNPIVLANYIYDPSLPTLLIYGHYDVQPADASDWRTNDPFTLSQTEQKVFARGAVDNKGQIMIHIYTVLELIKTNNLRYNIKFMIEWDEETGSPFLTKFIEDYKDELKADYCIISDGEMIGNHTPTMTASFRWGANMTIKYISSKTDLHSGIYGGIAPSTSYELSKILSKLYDSNGLIAIPGRYDDLAPITDLQKANNAKVPFDIDEIKKISEIRDIWTPKGYDPVTANWLLPTIQISWLNSWYTWDGYKNIIPHQATAKINFRFWPWQSSTKMIDLFKNWIAENTPKYISFEIQTSDPYDAILLDVDNDINRSASQIISDIYNKPAIMRYCWAAVPVSGMFQNIWMQVTIVDLGNEDCNMHGVDENFDKVCIEKWLEFSKKFLSK